MASSEAEPEKLVVTDQASRAETGGGAGGEKKPTKLSDFNLGRGTPFSWVSALDTTSVLTVGSWQV